MLGWKNGFKRALGKYFTVFLCASTPRELAFFGGMGISAPFWNSLIKSSWQTQRLSKIPLQKAKLPRGNWGLLLSQSTFWGVLKKNNNGVFFPQKTALIMPARRRQERQGSPVAF